MSEKLKKSVFASKKIKQKFLRSKSNYDFSEDAIFDVPKGQAENKGESTELVLEKNRFNNFLDIVISIGRELSGSENIDHSLELLLTYAQNVTNADAGTIYVKTKVNQLDFKVISNRTLGIKVSNPQDQEGSLCTTPLKLFDPKTGQPNLGNVACYVFHKNERVLINDAMNNTEYDFSGTRVFDKKNNYISKSFLTLPLRNHQNQVIGILQLINATDTKSNTVIPFRKSHLKIVEALAALTAICLNS